MADSIVIKKPVAGKPLDLKLADLKSVLGDRLEVACLNPSVIPGTKGSIMIPGNEPCPDKPHNHDKVLGDKSFQKIFVLKAGLSK